MRAYPAELRLRVLAARGEGEAAAEVAERFSVSESWVRRVHQRERESGETAPRKPSRAARPPRLAAHADRLLALTRERPGLTAAGYRDLLGEPVAAVTVWRALRSLGLTHKKR